MAVKNIENYMSDRFFADGLINHFNNMIKSLDQDDIKVEDLNEMINDNSICNKVLTYWYDAKIVEYVNEKS